MATIRLESVTVTAGRQRILDDIDLEVRDGELMVLLGSSGSGKTSILRAIAGLDHVSSGRVFIDDVECTRKPTRRRDVAMVFQDNALFPTHTVRQNVEFPLRVRKMRHREIDARVNAESRALHIEQLLERHPRELSAGHQQLAQIARAMVRAPQVFLLDEPLSRVDRPTRVRLRHEIKTMQEGYGVSMVYATNDPEESLALGDRLAVVEDGRIVQVGAPLAVWRDPVSRSVAALTGQVGLLDAMVEADAEGFWLVGSGMRMRAWAPVLGDHVGHQVTIGIRPADIRLAERGPVEATLGRLAFNSGEPGRDVVVGGSPLASLVGADDPEGDAVRVAFDRFHVFSPSGRLICTV